MEFSCKHCGTIHAEPLPGEEGRHTGWWAFSGYSDGLVEHFGWYCPECSKKVFDSRRRLSDGR